MGDRRSQFDMSHPFAPYRRAGDFYAALIADNTAIAHVLILTTITLPIFRWPEDRFAEQSVFFWTQTTIIDRLRFGDFTIRPGADVFRRCQTNAQRAKILCFQGLTLLCAKPIVEYGRLS